MRKTFIGVRDVDEEVFRQFKARTVEERMKLGEALSRAMARWVEEQKRSAEKNRILKPKVKPIDFGTGTEKTSLEVDEILYA